MNSGFHRLHALRMENDERGYRMEEMHLRFEALANRHKNGTAPRAVSAFNLFQTPPALAERMAELANLSPGQTVLEPSAGLGRLLTAADAKAANLVAVAVEIAPACCRELFINRGDLKIFQRDFLALTPSEAGLFDRVIMNPPFKLRRDIAHIRHALTFLKPGGLLTALCLSTDHRRNAFQEIAETFETIPAGTFRGEGTNVETILLTIRA